MSAVIRPFSNVLSHSVSHIALNPLVTAPLLWVLTQGPPEVRARLFSQFASLRDPRRLTQIVKALKWLLALSLVRTINAQLNRLALNAWRLKSEKGRWTWDQEVAVVTGGCSGFGERVCKRLINKGVTVAILDIQQLPLSLQGYANIKFFACDITKPTAVNSAAERIRATLGSPSILVNNAGIGSAHTILGTPDEYLHKIFDVNILSHFTLVKAFVPAMIAANKGHVVTVASTASFLGVAGMVDYSCTKAAALAFHEGLGQELREHHDAPKVLTTIVHPNWSKTSLLAPFEKTLQEGGTAFIDPDEVSDAIVNQIFSCAGGQLFLPQHFARVSLLRGYPHWFQETIRAGAARAVLPAVSK
ncbi:hypothetical protein BDV95DRAFT_614010 [Massariosphaeria phaeospora]|uniref:Short-chain dehydrogenase/reductase 3 n=1 Tax=Massariosphaeria phaeospora TaxID=100035 RepID=A0A7C8MLJ2_9PLEO|nr:hypothetical protein BDV95DRAFT_614010 [Massariosphaeria phaeospora]